MAEVQIIPARNGTATFVPMGKVIKILNASGTQVVDMWAFALPKPEAKKTSQEPDQSDVQAKAEEAENSTTTSSQKAPAATPKKKKRGADLPSQEEAEQATREGLAQGEQAEQTTAQKKSGWTSYVPTGYVPSVPSLGFGQKKGDDGGAKDETEQQKNSRTWGSYFTAGKGFTSYIPKQATETVTQLAGFVSAQTWSVPNRTTADDCKARARQIEIVSTAAPRFLQDTRGCRWNGSSDRLWLHIFTLCRLLSLERPERGSCSCDGVSLPYAHSLQHVTLATSSQ
jgi:hypothetical protein